MTHIGVGGNPRVESLIGINHALRCGVPRANDPSDPAIAAVITPSA